MSPPQRLAIHWAGPVYRLSPGEGTTVVVALADRYYAGYFILAKLLSHGGDGQGHLCGNARDRTATGMHGGGLDSDQPTVRRRYGEQAGLAWTLQHALIDALISGGAEPCCLALKAPACRVTQPGHWRLELRDPQGTAVDDVPCGVHSGRPARGNVRCHRLGRLLRLLLVFLQLELRRQFLLCLRRHRRMTGELDGVGALAAGDRFEF
jgi:hypothetical protein